MKKFNIYVQDNCDFCKEIIIPEGLEVTKIYTNRDDFESYIPQNVPVMQMKTFQLEGPYQINEFLDILANAKK